MRKAYVQETVMGLRLYTERLLKYIKNNVSHVSHYWRRVLHAWKGRKQERTCDDELE